MKKLIYSVVCLMAFSVIFWSLVACGEKPVITLNETSVSITVSGTHKIDVSVTENATLKYSSSDASIAKVSSDGVITGVKAGQAVITIQCAKASSVSLVVTVIETTLTVPGSITVYEGSPQNINAVVTPVGKTLTYSSSNESVATVDSNGMITGVSSGNSIITVMCEGVENQYINVTVEQDLTNQIVVTNDVTSIKVDEKLTLEYTNKISDDVVSFKSSDRDIATVTSKGVVTAKKGGVVTITLTSGYTDYECKFELTVIDEVAPVIEFTTVTDNDNHSWGEKFYPLIGVKAIDDGDGDVTSSIKVTGSVNIKRRGTYTITYTVSDSCGNTASMDRKINVVWDWGVQFIGHGGCYYGVFNTMEGFKYALDTLQYTCIETDLQTTKDGVFVLCHDSTFAGVSVANTNYADLAKLTQTSTRNLGYPSTYGLVKNGGVYSSKICTLKEYLELAHEYDATCVIEIKGSAGLCDGDTSKMPELMQMIKDCDMLDNVIFLGNVKDVFYYVKKYYSYIPCQYLVNSIESDTYLQRCIDNGWDISFNATGGYSNSDSWIKKYKDAGCKVSCWTFTCYCDYKEVQSWIDKGVDYVTCDWQGPENFTLPKASTSSRIYTVTFKDWNGNTLKVCKVPEGIAAPAPSDPTRNGYTFSGWDTDFSKVRSNLTVTATYTQNA